jgi:cobalt-zinc-cadmium efflux system outer membrane protein
VIATRRVEHYQSTLLPLWEEIVNETQLQYNAMQMGVFQLLLARREQVRTGQDYVMALRNYWQARSRLDQILAGRLVAAPDVPGMETPGWR